MAKILLVEDDEPLALSVKDWLTSFNHTVDVVGDGASGLDWIKSDQYELIILDWEIPTLNRSSDKDSCRWNIRSRHHADRAASGRRQSRGT